MDFSVLARYVKEDTQRYFQCGVEECVAIRLTLLQRGKCARDGGGSIGELAEIGLKRRELCRQVIAKWERKKRKTVPLEWNGCVLPMRQLQICLLRWTTQVS